MLDIRTFTVLLVLVSVVFLAGMSIGSMTCIHPLCPSAGEP